MRLPLNIRTDLTKWSAAHPVARDRVAEVGCLRAYGFRWQRRQAQPLEDAGELIRWSLGKLLVVESNPGHVGATQAPLSNLVAPHPTDQPSIRASADDPTVGSCFETLVAAARDRPHDRTRVPDQVNRSSVAGAGE